MNPTARPASRQSCTCSGRSDQASTCTITTRPASSQQQQRQQQQRPQQQTQSRAPRAHSPSPTGTMRGQPATQPTTSHCQSFPASHIQSSQPPATTRKHLHLARAAGPHLEAPADAGREPQLEVPALSARGRTAYLGHMRSICSAIKDDMRCDQGQHAVNMLSTCGQHACGAIRGNMRTTCGQHAVRDQGVQHAVPSQHASGVCTHRVRGVHASAPMVHSSPSNAFSECPSRVLVSKKRNPRVLFRVLF